MDGSQRHLMWCDLLGEKYKNEWIPGNRMHMKKRFAETLGKLPHEVHTNKELKGLYPMSGFSMPEIPKMPSIQFKQELNSLECCEAKAATPIGACAGTKYHTCDIYGSMVNYQEQEKGTTTMTCMHDTPETRKTDYLDRVLSSSYHQKRSDLVDKFGMNPPKPTSPKELVDWVKAGNFTFQKNFLNDDGTWRDDTVHPWYNSMTDMLVWTDPTHPKDEASYDTAVENLDEAYAKALNRVAVLTPAEGLAALESFEAQEF